MGIHERLALAREHAGYASASDAAEAFGWSYSTYAGHENGSRGFQRSAEKYARAFRVNLEWLLTGRGNMTGGIDDETADIIDLYKRIPTTKRAAARQMLWGLAEDARPLFPGKKKK